MLLSKLIELGAEISVVYGHRNRETLPLRFTDSVDEVFSGSDAVIICVPPEHNFALAMKALDRGLHVFIEKPMTVGVAEAEQIERKAGATGVVLMVGHQLCYADNLPEIQAISPAFAVGRLKRSPSSAKLNPYWNLGCHLVALFDVLRVTAYGVELIFDPRFGSKGYEISFWREGQEFAFTPSGDLYGNELAAFLACIETGSRPLTDAVHGRRVVAALQTRYGSAGYGFAEDYHA